MLIEEKQACGMRSHGVCVQRDDVLVLYPDSRSCAAWLKAWLQN